MTLLDTQVYRMMLHYPTLFNTRFDALCHLYLTIGNGYEWSADGRLINLYDGYEKTDEQASKEFFDKMHTKSELEKKIVQFRFENLIDLSLAPIGLIQSRYGLNVHSLVRTFSKDYSTVMNVPDDAEESFKNGAREVMNVLIPALSDLAQCGHDFGVRKELIDERNRLFPTSKITSDFIKEMLKNL